MDVPEHPCGYRAYAHLKPPPPIPVPPRSLPRARHTNSFALCPLPHSQQLITLRVEMLLNERFPMLAPWGKGAPRRWKSILMNRFKNERYPPLPPFPYPPPRQSPSRASRRPRGVRPPPTGRASTALVSASSGVWCPSMGMKTAQRSIRTISLKAPSVRAVQVRSRRLPPAPSPPRIRHSSPHPACCVPLRVLCVCV